MSDLPSFNIRPLPQGGYVVTEDGEEVAAFSTPAETSMWMETRLNSLPMERQRAAVDADVVSMAQVLQPAEPKWAWKRRQS